MQVNSISNPQLQKSSNQSFGSLKVLQNERTHKIALVLVNDKIDSLEFGNNKLGNIPTELSNAFDNFGSQITKSDNIIAIRKLIISAMSDAEAKIVSLLGDNFFENMRSTIYLGEPRFFEQSSVKKLRFD